jgi:PEGA domain
MDKDRRTRVRKLLMVVAGLSVVAAPSRARAQSPAAESAPKAEQAPAAETLFNEGKKQYAAGKLQAAYDAYRKAWELKQTYDIAANLANAEKLLGKNRDAAEHYAYSLRNFPVTEQSGKREAIEKKLAAVRKEVGALAIEVNVEAAEVRVDGTRVGSSPLPDEVFVEPGPYTVSAQREGYVQATQSGLAGKGVSTVKIKLTLAERKEARGSDGHAAGGPQGAAGTQRAGGAHGKPPDPGFQPGPAWFITGGALAVVGVGVGVGLNLAANGAGAHAQDLGNGKAKYACSPKLTTTDPVCPELHDTLVRWSKLSDGAMAGYIAGGALALGTAGLGLWALTRPKAPPTMTVTPTVGKHEAGLLITGVW